MDKMIKGIIKAYNWNEKSLTIRDENGNEWYIGELHPVLNGGIDKPTFRVFFGKVQSSTIESIQTKVAIRVDVSDYDAKLDGNFVKKNAELYFLEA